jgi:hypothetical protein
MRAVGGQNANSAATITSAAQTPATAHRHSPGHHLINPPLVGVSRTGSKLITWVIAAASVLRVMTLTISRQFPHPAR